MERAEGHFEEIGKHHGVEHPIQMAVATTGRDPCLDVPLHQRGNQVPESSHGIQEGQDEQGHAGMSWPAATGGSRWTLTHVVVKRILG